MFGKFMNWIRKKFGRICCGRSSIDIDESEIDSETGFRRSTIAQALAIVEDHLAAKQADGQVREQQHLVLDKVEENCRPEYHGLDSVQADSGLECPGNECERLEVAKETSGLTKEEFERQKAQMEKAIAKARKLNAELKELVLILRLVQKMATVERNFPNEG